MAISEMCKKMFIKNTSNVWNSGKNVAMIGLI